MGNDIKDGKRELKMLLTFIVFLLSMSSTITLLFPLVDMQLDGVKYQVLGISAVFGASVKTSNFTYHFCFGLLAAYLLIFLGVVLSLFLYKKQIKWLYFVDMLLFVAAIVILLNATKLFASANSIEPYITTNTTYSLGFGGVMSIILATISIIILGITTYLNFKYREQ